VLNVIWLTKYGLFKQREELEKLKAEIVVAMKEYEMLRVEKQRINLELFEVEQEGEQYQRAISDTKASTRQLEQQILDIDVDININHRL
jgi:predicted  nucleic acid-binding Zn-ribbon protein